LAEQGRVEEAVVLLRARADAGDWRAAILLIGLLAGRGRVEEAVALLRAWADAGDWRAANRLIGLLAGHGRIGELRTEVHAGRPGAAAHLVELVAARSGEEAERLRRFGLTTLPAR
jgi:hypothetical protein